MFLCVDVKFRFYVLNVLMLCVDVICYILCGDIIFLDVICNE